MDRMLKKVMEMRDAGQKEYARKDSDVHANFKRVAEQTNTTPEKVLMVYLLKHVDGIISWVDGNDSQREDVTGRITDAITYLCLLRGMVESER